MSPCHICHSGYDAEFDEECPDVGTIFMCGDRLEPQQFCQMPQCRREPSKLCDYPMGRGKTCDLHLCIDHATEIGPDLHLCPIHFTMLTRDIGMAKAANKVRSIITKATEPETT